MPKTTLNLLALVLSVVTTTTFGSTSFLGEARLINKEWRFTVIDANSGLKTVYLLNGFNQKNGKKVFEGDFLFVKLDAEDIKCTHKLPCLKVKSFEPQFYDPLNNSPDPGSLK